MAQWLANPTRNHEVADSIPGLVQWIKNLALLWAVMWLADAAQIPCCCGSGVGRQLVLGRPLAWEPPYAVGAGLEKTKNKQTKFIQLFTHLHEVNAVVIIHLCLMIFKTRKFQELSKVIRRMIEFRFSFCWHKLCIAYYFLRLADLLGYTLVTVSCDPMWVTIFKSKMNFMAQM